MHMLAQYRNNAAALAGARWASRRAGSPETLS